MELNSRYTQNISKPLKQLDFKNQNFDLTYVYPILVDTSLSKYSGLVRDFIACQIIKELFISNTINIINSTSGYQIKDEYNNNVMVNVGGQGQQFNKFQEYKYELQQALNNNLQRLIGLIQNDPTFSNLRPSVDVIHLDNNAQVPVIVGTKEYQIDTFGLSIFLLAGITNNISLAGYENIDRIKQQIDKINPTNFPHFVRELLKNDPAALAPLLHAPNKPKFNQTTKDINTIYTSFQSSIDKAYMFLRNINNQKRIYDDCGIDLTSHQMSDVISKFSIEINEIFNHVRYSFNEDMALYGNRLIVSLFDLCSPLDEKLNFNQYANVVITELNNTIFKTISEDFISIINNVFSNDMLIDVKQQQLNQICASVSNTKPEWVNYNSNLVSNIPKTFSASDQLIDFIETLYDTTTNIVHINDNIIHQLITLCNNDKDIIRIFQNDIYIRIVDTLQKYCRNLLSQNIQNNKDSKFSILYGGINNTIGLPQDKLEQLITNLCEDCAKYIFGMLLYRIQEALCKYVNLISSSVEIKKNNVIAWPNFALLLPIESILLCASILNLKNWKDYYDPKVNQEPEYYKFTKFQTKESKKKIDELKQQGKMAELSLTTNINNNKIKYIATNMIRKLNIPNLFIFDQKKSVVYYRLLYQSNIQMMNISSMETFLKYLKNQQEQNLSKIFNPNNSFY